jgi:hypothetical protein
MHDIQELWLIWVFKYLCIIRQAFIRVVFSIVNATSIIYILFKDDFTLLELSYLSDVTINMLY